MKMEIPRVPPKVNRLCLDETSEEIEKRIKKEKAQNRSKKRLFKLSDETAYALKVVQEHKVLQLAKWRSLKFDLDKLQGLLDRLNKELVRLRKNRV